MKYETALEFIKPLAEKHDLKLKYVLTEKKFNEVGFSDLLTILLDEERVGAISLDISEEIFKNYILEMFDRLILYKLIFERI